MRSYILGDECLADENQFAMPPDLAVAADPAQLEVGGLVRILEPVRISSRRRRVVPCRRSLAERLMRALMIDLGAERIEAPLLGRRGGGWRAGALDLEGPMHSFMASVLLRLAGLDSLRRNAELDPPHREPAQSSRSYRGERRAVVRANRVRQSLLSEHPLQLAAAVGVVRPRHRLSA